MNMISTKAWLIVTIIATRSLINNAYDYKKYISSKYAERRHLLRQKKLSISIPQDKLPEINQRYPGELYTNHIRRKRFFGESIEPNDSNFDGPGGDGPEYSDPNFSGPGGDGPEYSDPNFSGPGFTEQEYSEPSIGGTGGGSIFDGQDITEPQTPFTSVFGLPSQQTGINGLTETIFYTEFTDQYSPYSTIGYDDISTTGSEPTTSTSTSMDYSTHSRSAGSSFSRTRSEISRSTISFEPNTRTRTGFSTIFTPRTTSSSEGML